ncbi:MAG: hypothetical protein M1831_001686 [Alyxoria varia]|nr:MAG: hypothetical protein M1831_001686 [Alyxoria varia]
MLHELLLSLSGHPTPLFDDPKTFPTTTPAEHTLLTTLSHLSHLHTALRQHIPRIHAYHRSPICRSVATTIQRTHLRAFQQTILDAEKDILRNDPSVVGAYDIVPLAGLVGRFEEWRRRLEWLWGVVGFILPPPGDGAEGQDEDDGDGAEGQDEDDGDGAKVDGAHKGACNGARLIDKLREEAKTGYPDIAKIVQDLIKVAEGAWVRQLAGWLLQGRRAISVSSSSASSQNNDFFIQKRSYGSQRKTSKRKVPTERLAVNYALLPDFVSQETASSVLYIGKTLNYLDGVDVADTTEALSSLSLPQDNNPSKSTTTTHLSHISPLSALEPPITNTTLARAIHDIRADLTHQLTHGGILPITRILSTLRHLHSFFLGARIDFHAQLIRQADEHLRARHSHTRTGEKVGQRRGGDVGDNDLAAVMMKDAEVSSVLAKTWVALAPGLQVADPDSEEHADADLEWARENLVLQLHKPSSTTTSGQHNRNHSSSSSGNHDDDGEASSSSSSSFSEKDEEDSDSEAIMTGSTQQTAFHIPPSATTPFNSFLLSTPTTLTLPLKPPLDLFLNPHEITAYSTISNYLLSIRRSHMHLTDLWRESSLRRGSSTIMCSSSYATHSAQRSRQRAAQREKSMRSTWTTAFSAVFLLTELGEYLTREVVTPSWESFNSWVYGGRVGEGGGGGSSRSSNGGGSAVAQTGAGTNTHTANRTTKAAKITDPTLLTKTHTLYLSTLLQTLHLHNTQYTSALRTLLQRIDTFCALVTRLQGVWRNLDLADEGVMDEGNAVAGWETEERDLYTQLTQSKKTVSEAVNGVIESLTAIEAEKYEDTAGAKSRRNLTTGGFEPHAGGGVDRLLLRLQGRMYEGGDGDGGGEAV